MHPLGVWSILSRRERLISFQPVHDDVVQRSRLMGLWDCVSLHTPRGHCLLCLVEGRSFFPVQSHYGLSVTPSFLLGCSQDGITRVYYRPVCAKFWLMRDKDMCTQACTLVCTHTLSAEQLSESMPNYSALLR